MTREQQHGLIALKPEWLDQLQVPFDAMDYAL